MKKLSPKVKYIIYGVMLGVFIVWLTIGSMFITPESDAVICFFGLSLPFLGIFGMVGCLAHLAWKQHSVKRTSENTAQNEEQKKGKR